MSNKEVLIIRNALSKARERKDNLSGENRGPYELTASALSTEAEMLIHKGHVTEAETLLRLAQVHATLNISDELTRYFKPRKPHTGPNR